MTWHDSKINWLTIYSTELQAWSSNLQLAWMLVADSGTWWSPTGGSLLLSSLSLGKNSPGATFCRFLTKQGAKKEATGGRWRKAPSLYLRTGCWPLKVCAVVLLNSESLFGIVIYHSIDRLCLLVWVWCFPDFDLDSSWQFAFKWGED